MNSQGSDLSGISGVKSHLHSDSSIDNEYWVNLKVEETHQKQTTLMDKL